MEDEADHRVLVNEALRRLDGEVRIHEVGSAREAVDWMRGVAGRPELLDEGVVILDLGLPGPSGFRILEWMRDTPALAEIPVVVFTASENPMDAEHAFNLGARGYFQKPTDFRRYLEIFGRVFKMAEGSPAGDER